MCGGAIAAAMVLSMGVMSSTVAAAESAELQEWSKLPKKKQKKLRKKAKRYEKRGKKAYSQGKYDDALVAFGLSYKVAPEPRYLFNIGRCYEQKGDLYTAMEYIQRYVTEEKEGDEREEAQDFVDILEGKLKMTSGEVSVVTNPPGATVKLTRANHDLTGKTPLNRWVPSDAWKLTVMMPGYVPHRSEIVVGVGERTEKLLELQPTEDAAVAAAPEAPKPAADPKEAEVVSAKPTGAETEVEGAAPAPEEAPVAAKAQAGPAASDSPEAQESPGASKPVVYGWPVIATLGGGAVLLMAGVAFGLQASAAKEELDDFKSVDGADFDTVQAKYGEYENHSLVANVLLVGGGVALAAGGALWFMSTSTESVAVVLGPDRLLLRGRF